MNNPRDCDEDRLDALFARYREACPDVEPSADFMPRLWERIEGRQSWGTQVWKWANGFVAAAAAASLFFVMLQMLPGRASDFYTSTYVEALADEHDNDQVLGEFAMTASHSRQGGFTEE